MKKSIERGRFEAEFLGGRFSGAYCEATIGGVPHTVDFRLVEGYSSRDHMADVPLAAMVEAVGGQEFATAKALRHAAFVAGSRSMKATAPRIDATVEPGTLAARWRRVNLEAARAKAGGDGYTLSGYDITTRDGVTTARFDAVWDAPGSRGCPGSVRVSTEDSLEEPDAEWTFERASWAS